MRRQDALVLKQLLVAYLAIVELGFDNELYGIENSGFEGLIIEDSLLVVLSQVNPHVVPNCGREVALIALKCAQGTHLNCCCLLQFVPAFDRVGRSLDCGAANHNMC